MEPILINKKEFFKINILKIKQKENEYYVGTIKAPELENLCALEPMDYYKKEYGKKTKKLQALLSKYENPQETLEEGFNRDVNPSRIDEVSDFITNDDYAFLPNSIIVSAKLKNDYFSNDELNNPENCKDEIWLQRFVTNQGVYIYDNFMYVPNDSNSFLLIDGQHRLLGFDTVDYQIKKDYDLIVSFLTGIDSSVTAKIFYTINYNQKPVNKSVLTYLTNEFSDNLNESKLLHEYIRIMNNNPKSPLENKIKILGTGPGYISLAFLHEKLLPFFLNAKETSKVIPIYCDLYTSNQVYILNSILRYFTAIIEILGDRWDNKDTVFTKTIGIGALIDILPQVILSSLTDYSSSENINNIKVSDYKKVLGDLKVNETKFSKSGGLGTLNLIKKELIEYLSLQDYNKNFIKQQKIQWIIKCNKN